MLEVAGRREEPSSLGWIGLGWPGRPERLPLPGSRGWGSDEHKADTIVELIEVVVVSMRRGVLDVSVRV